MMRGKVNRVLVGDVDMWDVGFVLNGADFREGLEIAKVVR